jgi:hypothetical protein
MAGLDTRELMEKGYSLAEEGDSLYDQSLMAGDDGLPVAPEPHKLSQYDTDSAVWLRMKKFLEEKLTELRVSNDEHRSELETAAIRGKIKLTKEFLALGEPSVRDDPSGPSGLGY